MSFLRKMKWTPVFLLVLLAVPFVYVARAATTPSLGTADTFGLLAHTFAVNGNGINVITGDLGYSNITYSGPNTYTATGATHVADGAYTQAGANQNTALAALNSQACSFTFTGPFQGGFLDLATDTTHGTLGIYTPGVYCVNEMVAKVTIGATGITLDGNGTYIFRINGSLITVGNSVVSLTNGASACDVFWTPVDNAISSVFGWSSEFVGTVIDTQGFSVHDSVTWLGRALAFGGTVTWASNESIRVPDTCTPPPATATLHVIKTFYNDYGGTAVSSDAIVHVKNGAGDVAGSPHAGAVSPGTSYTLNADTYTVSEDVFAGYTAIFSGDCDATGHVTLGSGDNKTCTISNDQNPPPPPPPSISATLHVIKHVINDNGGTATASSFYLHVKGSSSFGVSDVVGSPAIGVETPGTSYTLNAGTYAVSEDPFAGYSSSFTGDCDDGGNITLAAGADKICTITNNDIVPPSVPPATLHVIKIVINDNGGKALVSEAVMHVTSGLGDVAGSPQAGASAPGTSYTLNPGTYTVSENFFPGYTVKVAGDCGENGMVTLASGDNKTCTITNNDIAGVVPPPPPPPPPTVTPADCDICSKLTYDLYIINPNGTERHTGTPWVRVTSRGNKVLRYSFEDATIDPHNILYDYNDSVIDVDYKDCTNTTFMFVSSDASWKHQIRIKISLNGVTQSDTLITDDSKAVVGTFKTLNATAGVNVKVACPAAPPSSAPTSSTGLKGKILLQVQQHGEAWYVHPVSGLRYYMKDGPTAYGMMRKFGLGITDKDLANIPSVDSVDALKQSTSVCTSNRAANAQKGKILLQVQQHGEAWYVDVTKCRRIYLKDGAMAYTIMRFLGLGITDVDLAKLKIGQ